MRVLSFLNNPKGLGLSYKVDLDFFVLEWKKKLSYNGRNTVYTKSYAEV